MWKGDKDPWLANPASAYRYVDYTRRGVHASGDMNISTRTGWRYSFT